MDFMEVLALMPYIKPEERAYFEELLKQLGRVSLSGPGELNFLFTEIINQYLETRTRNYQCFNDIIGALEACKLELYRRKVGSYEDIKIRENGEVYK